MAHTLPDLPYDYTALEPTIDEQTMRIHHDKHHATYVTNLNNALQGLARRTRSDRTDQEPLVAARRRADCRPQQRRRSRQPHHVLGDHGSRRRGQPTGALAAAIDRDLGGFDALKDAVRQGGRWSLRLRLGLGRPQGRQALRHSTPNQDNPLMDGPALRSSVSMSGSTPTT